MRGGFGYFFVPSLDGGRNEPRMDLAWEPMYNYEVTGKRDERMEFTADELAGVVDMYGTLTRSELVRTLEELAYKRGSESYDPTETVSGAIASYHLVELDPAVVDGNLRTETAGTEFETDSRDDPLVIVGPTAFPSAPDGAEDLPHIVDVPDRSIDPESVTDTINERFVDECVSAIRSDDDASIERMIDISYEIEAWRSLDLAGVRERLIDARRS